MNLSLRNYLLPLPCTVNLKGEALLCREIYIYLTSLTLDKKINCVWFAVCNENSNNRQPVHGAKLRAIGKRAGVADYIFMHKNGSLAIEVKVGRNKQQESQILFESWCTSVGIPYILARSLEDVRQALISWNILL